MNITGARDEDGLIKKSLRYSVFDGSCHAAMLGFGESYLSVFAVFLKANNIQLALISSLPVFIGSIAQILSSMFLRLLKTRKTLVSSAAFMQAIMYIPIALTFFVRESGVNLLIFIVCIYWIFGMILSPAWNSWMGDLVDERIRGDYFGRRSKVTGSATFAATLIAGFILHRFTDGDSAQYIGFVLIFLLAMAARMLSSFFLTKKYEPPYAVALKRESGLFEFIKGARFSNYGRLVLYLCFMNFSVYLSVPFFVPYMLRDLSLDYMTFTFVISTAAVAKFVSMPVWGKASDRYGTRKILSLCGLLMPSVPLLWVFSGNVYYLLLIQVYSGFVWAGFDLAAFNFIYDTTTPQNRMSGVEYYNVLNGLCIFAGSIIGGLMVRYNDLFWSKYLFVFIISFILRYAATFVFIPKLKEVRTVERIPYAKLFFKIVSTVPTFGVVYDLIPFRSQRKNK
ncbi:MAG: MFS transporter [Nitrospiraceae bacterium]|nr:MAG: MFS transporter [Nitrospiraceae bacterium]